MASGGQSQAEESAYSTQATMAALVDARVVECATKLFLVQGISAVKMTDIADDAGVGVATLYRHFSTKAAIAADVASVLWQHLEDSYEELVASDTDQRLDGAGQLKLLLDLYCTEHLYRPGFASFIDELDRLIMEGAVSEESVSAYAQVLARPYAHYQKAYELGRSDGSIGRQTDFALFYRSLAHALLSVASKLSRGEVLPSDDFSGAATHDELACLVDMAIRSLDVRG